MKKVLLLCAAMALVATSAFAVGADLNFGACPGNAAATTDATFDCAGAGALVMYCTFQPNEAMPDLVGIDTVVDFTIVGGDVNNSASFWDFQNANSVAYAVSHVRPTTICNAYTAAWSVGGSGEGQAAVVRSPSQVRIGASAYRPSDLSVTANQKIYGYSLTIDGSTAIEAGGAGVGCTLQAVVALNQVNPGTSSGTPTTALSSPSTNGTPCDHINGDVSNCSIVPTARHTWGQLKSLYR
jgi:hypothetical protein